jgi:hypothetical protein
LENSAEIPQKLKIDLSYDSAIPCLVIDISKGVEIPMLKRQIFAFPYSFRHYSQIIHTQSSMDN